MRNLLLVLFILNSSLSKAQDSNLTKQVIYCGTTMSVPADCEFKEIESYSINNKPAESSSIKKGKQFVHWFNNDALPIQVREEAFQQYLDQLLSNFREHKRIYKKKPAEFISLGQGLKGWIIKVKFDNENRYFLLASGEVNSVYMQIYCGLLRNPEKKESMPDFISQIIQLK